MTEQRARRIQRKRTKGWRMPAGTVYVGRGSKWGNPYVAGMCDPNVYGVNRVMIGDDVVKAFRSYVGRCIECNDDWLTPLRGKDLACWCPLTHACHADVLLELANNRATRQSR